MSAACSRARDDDARRLCRRTTTAAESSTGDRSTIGADEPRLVQHAEQRFADAGLVAVPRLNVPQQFARADLVAAFESHRQLGDVPSSTRLARRLRDAARLADLFQGSCGIFF
jgi:hypothetical protein